jgi:hypothetical protein
MAGPLAGFLIAVAGGAIFYLAAGTRETGAGALISSGIWVAAAIMSGLSVDALRRSRSAQQDLAVALAKEEGVREAQEETVRLSETLTAAQPARKI